MASPKILLALPSSGPPATPVPHTWGRLGREGVVVQFEIGTELHTLNFEPGLGGLTDLYRHPDAERWLVLAEGAAYVVDPDTLIAERVGTAVTAAWPLSQPDRLVFSKQDIYLECYGPTGLIWRTRRLSWDGFADVSVEAELLRGLAWDALSDSWKQFTVDLRSGRSSGGAESALPTGPPEILA